MNQLEQPTRLYLWRHPQVAGHEQGKFFGHDDVAMSDYGLRQMAAMAARMSQTRLAAVYASDLQRSLQPAQAIAAGQDPRLAAVSLAGLRELKLGIWEGLNYQQIAQRYPGQLEARQQDLAGFRVQGGESLGDLAARVLPILEDILGQHPAQEVCLVGHGGVNRVILCHVLGAPLEMLFRLEQEHGCLNIIEFFPDGVPVLKLMNLPLELPAD